MNALLQSLELEWVHPKSEALSRAPLYHQLYTVLRGAIMDGRVGYSEKLPTEDQLVETFELSRVTVKRAMAELASEKLITRSRGRGSHVIYHHQPKPMTAPLVGMLESYAELARCSTSRVTRIKRRKPPAKIRAELGVDSRENVLNIVRVHSNEQGVPYAHYSSWTPRVAEADFDSDQLASVSRLKILRNLGIELARATQVLGAEAADTAVAKELAMQPGEPLLSLMRRSYDDADRCVDVVYGLYNPNQFQYSVELSH